MFKRLLKNLKMDPIRLIGIGLFLASELFRDARDVKVIRETTREETNEQFHKYIGELEDSARKEIEEEQKEIQE